MLVTHVYVLPKYLFFFGQKYFSRAGLIQAYISDEPATEAVFARRIPHPALSGEVRMIFLYCMVMHLV